MRSSTSSSDRAGVPWALLLALSLLAAAEIGLRASRPDGLVPYGFESQAYRALAADLQAMGSRDLAVIGSSRAREAITAPGLERLLDQVGFSEWTAGNYALPRGHAMEVETALEHLLAADPPPRMIIYGVTPRQVLLKQSPIADRGHLWRLAPWWRARRRDGAAADRVLPQVIRNSLGDYVRLVRYRAEINHMVNKTPVQEWPSRTWKILFEPLRHEASPYRGDATFWHSQFPDRERAVTAAHVKAYVERLLVDGSYVLDEMQIAAFERSLANAYRAGIPVVVVEVPVKPILRQHWPTDTENRFRELLEARLGTATFLPGDRVASDFPDAWFQDQSHLNLLGATPLTEAIFDQAICPQLPGEPDCRGFKPQID